MLSNKWNRITKYISESELVEDVEEIQREIEEVSKLAKDRIKDIILRAAYLKEMKNDAMNDSFFPRNDIGRFLDAEIFPNNQSEYKALDLYNNYNTWCNSNERTRPIRRNKFYEVLKSGKRVKFEHRSYGDYFVFTLDNSEKTS